MNEEQKAALRLLLSGRFPLLLAVGAAAGGLVLVCLFAVLLLRPEGASLVEGPTPTPFVEVIAQPIAADVMISSDTMSVSVAAPISLDVGTRTFSVQAQTIPVDGAWAPAIANPNTAVWVYGTVINYVIGISDTAENRAAVERLAPGDEMTLRSRDGSIYNFAFSSRRFVPVTSRDVFAQTTPGITLVLMGSTGQERLVVQGRYVVATTTPAEDPNVVELGETAQFDGLQVTVTGAAHLFDRPEVPQGFAFYLIDFELQNISANVLDAGLLRLALIDHLGNQYALNPLASQIGNHLPLGGPLAPGQKVQATAGYQIPAGLESPVLRWVITRQDNNSQVQVNIPFRSGADVGEQAVVMLQQAEVSLDGTSLLLLGQLTNLGDQPLIVQEQNVSLSSDGTIYLILSTNPGLPWVVGAGQTMPFSLTFQRPVGSAAVFTVLNQPFQLDGLR
jgi:hypothetical protein